MHAKWLALCFWMVSLSMQAFADGVIKEVRCLTGGENQKIKIELGMYDDASNRWSGGYVKHGKKKPPIPIVPVERVDTPFPEGRPSEEDSTWLEIGPSGVIGQYEMMTQGALIYSFTYQNKKTGKKYDFSEDYSSRRDDGSACAFDSPW